MWTGHNDRSAVDNFVQPNRPSFSLEQMRAQAEFLASTSWSWTAPAAVVISGCSLLASVIWSWRNGRIAKRALTLAERQDARQAPALDLYLNESIAWSLSQASKRLLAFHVMVTNPSDRPSSIVGADLLLTYSVDDVLVVAKVPHSEDSASTLTTADIAPFRLPMSLGASGAVSGWFNFQVSLQLTGGRPIERYDLVVRDVYALSKGLQVTVFREVRDA